jgi:integrase/recombinase XerD
MLNNVVLRSSALARHRKAALLPERESYIRFLADQGKSRHKQRDASSYLVRVVERLGLSRLRTIRLEELRAAAEAWYRRSDQIVATGDRGRATFLRYARGWLRFHGKLVEPKKWNEPLDKRAELFKNYLQVELGFASRTIEGRIWYLNRFLSWLAANRIQLVSVSVLQVERYLDYLEAQGWKSTTISAAGEQLKIFFRFAERKRWGCRGVSQCIFGPRNPSIVRTPHIERGPQWGDVRRLIESTQSKTADDYRARAVLLLVSSYALRTSEICRLLLSDIDFDERVVTIRRSKNRITQRFPLNKEVETALKQYLEKGRPKSECRNVFLTLRKPHGPIYQASVYNITSTRMKRLGIASVNKGAHSLRHACANRLLRAGTPVPKVASLLGHVSSRCVGTYIQHSLEELRSVANFRLHGLWISK